MKRWPFLTIIVMFLLVGYVAAQELDHFVYLPLCLRGYGKCYRPPDWEQIMSNWKIIEPEATRNIVLNPSAETTGNSSTGGGATNTRTTTQSLYGSYSYHYTGSVQADVAEYTTETRSGIWYFITIRVRGTLPSGIQVTLNEGSTAWSTMDKLLDLDDDWELWGGNDLEVGAHDEVWFRPSGAGAFDFYIDGIQVEQKGTTVLDGYYTTYCDGDQDGCEWVGINSGSASTRSALVRSGGKILDFKDDLDFGVREFIGTGTAPVIVTVDGYAILDGGVLNNIKRDSAPFTLTGSLIASDADCDINASRQALEKLLAHDAYPQTGRQWQPVVIQYEGADVIKRKAAHYVGGLEATFGLNNYIHEIVPLIFLAPDPFWYAIGESSQGAGIINAAQFRYIAGRLRSTGQWDDLGITANPTTNGDVLALLYNPNDKKLYAGGDFTGFDGNAGWDYIARYDIENDTWEQVGGASDFNNIVRALAIAPDGTLYAGGDFTNAGGDANADYVAQLTSPAANWSAVSSGGTLGVNALAVGLDGTLYIGGYFTNWNAIANADYIVSWDGSAYAAMGTGADDLIRALDVGLSGEIYAGGDFANIGAASSVGIAYWDGAAWNDMSTGISAAGGDTVAGIGSDSRGLIYIGGTFTTAGGNSATNVALWNGTTFKALGAGTGDVRAVAVSPDDDVFFATQKAFGGFTSEITRWNGDAFVPIDVDLPSTPIVRAIAFGASDPTIESNYDWFIGFETTGTAGYNGSVTFTYNGSAPAYPRIEYTNSTAGNAPLVTIRNETTGKTIWLEYTLQPGESLVIDTDPQVQTAMSSYYGNRPDAVIQGSDFADFALQVGSNQITQYNNSNLGSPILPPFVIWVDTYDGFD